MHHTTGWQAYIAEHGRNIMGGPARIYAHTLPDKPESDWETLPGHAETVARLAGASPPRSVRKWAKLLGRWHDLGKRSNEFLDYIRRTSDPDAAENEDTAGRVDPFRLLGRSTSGLKPWATTLVGSWHFALPGIMEVCRTCLGTALICVRCATNPRICERRVKFVFFSPSPTNGEGD